VDLIQIFNTTKPIIGVVHLLPLPTSARWGGSLTTVIERAEQEATALAAGGVHGIILENFFDTPFTKDKVDPAVISAMTLIVDRIKNLVVIPVGINLLRNDSIGAMAIASTIDAQFIRVNALTGIMTTDQGFIEGNAHQLLRYRKELGANVIILADVLVKHARPLDTINLTDAVKDTVEKGLADGIVLSGWSESSPPSIEDLKLAATVAEGIPIFVGSGANSNNISNLMNVADGVIVARSLKRHGKISDPIDPIRVAQFIEVTKQNIYLQEKLDYSSS
jgi:membrane complex biogenesis BtpA family protein|tara:strand:+ start:39397 stop:40230 length:834 start_codon:yes stop_codon:yes gene_type:complete